MQAYSDPKRESDPHALPDVEVFFVSPPDARQAKIDASKAECAEDDVQHWETQSGWYWWSCFPGCMPDSDPIGPFATEAEALADARESAGLCEHGCEDDEPCEACDAPEGGAR